MTPGPALLPAADLPVRPVAATIDLAAAAAADWAVVVVGAGPAGAATAARLAAGGLPTLLVDRAGLPRGKVCGCCLSTAALAEIKALETALAGSRQPPSGTALTGSLPLTTVRITGRGRSTRLPLPGGVVLSRERLDAALARAAIAAGCRWLPEVDVLTVREPADGTEPLQVIVRPRGQGAAAHSITLSTRLVVLAGGLAETVRVTAAEVPGGFSSRRRIAVASRIGIGVVLEPTASDLPAGELVMAVGQAGYCGIVRLEDGRLDLAAAVDPALLRGGHPAAALRTILTDADGGATRLPIAAAALATAACRATPRLTHRAAASVGSSGRVLRVGDAAGYVEPFTGEGIGWALAGGRLAATAVLQSLPLAAGGPHTAAPLYARAHAAHFQPRHARCRRVARCLRMPAVVAGALEAARWAPWAARRVVPLLVGHSGSIALGPREGSTPSRRPT